MLIQRLTHASTAPIRRTFPASPPQQETEISLDQAASFLLDETGEATRRWSTPLPFALTNRPVNDDRGRLFMATSEGVTRVSPETGRPLWSFPAEESRTLSDPAFTADGDLIVVGNFTHTYILDGETGELKNHIPLDHKVIGVPAAGQDGTLVLASYADGLLNQEAFIYGVDPARKPERSLVSKLLSHFMLSPRYDTAHEWKHPINQKADDLMERMPMTPRGKTHQLIPLPTGDVCGVTGPDEVLSVDPATGTERWRRELGGANLYDPVVVDSKRVLVAGPQTLHLLDAETGDTLSSKEAGGVLMAQPTSDGAGHLFYFTGFDELHCLDLTGEGRSWNARGDFQTDLPPVTDGTHVYAFKDQALFALDPATGEERFRLRCPGSRVTSPPAVAEDGTLVVKIKSGQGEELVGLTPPHLARARQTPTVEQGLEWVQLGDFGLEVRDG